jgi:hypothetical protein
MLNPHGPSPSDSQDHSNEQQMGSIDQTELSRYKRLYNQARDDLEELNGQAKRRSFQNVDPGICAHRNSFLGKLPLAGRNWDVAYASLSLCLKIYQQSSTSMTYTASYVRAQLTMTTRNLQILKTMRLMRRKESWLFF